MEELQLRIQNTTGISDDSESSWYWKDKQYLEEEIVDNSAVVVPDVITSGNINAISRFTLRVGEWLEILQFLCIQFLWLNILYIFDESPRYLCHRPILWLRLWLHQFPGKLFYGCMLLDNPIFSSCLLPCNIAVDLLFKSSSIGIDRLNDWICIERNWYKLQYIPLARNSTHYNDCLLFCRQSDFRCHIFISCSPTFIVILLTLH